MVLTSLYKSREELQRKNRHGWHGFKKAACFPTLPTEHTFPPSTLITERKRVHAETERYRYNTSHRWWEYEIVHRGLREKLLLFWTWYNAFLLVIVRKCIRIYIFARSGRALRLQSHTGIPESRVSNLSPNFGYSHWSSLWSSPCILAFTTMVQLNHKIFQILSKSLTNTIRRCRPTVCYTVCPTRYRTRHFFNNSNTNEGIAAKFEQEYVHMWK